MKKYFPHISTFILTFVIIFAVSGFLFPQTAHAGFWDVVECTVNPIDCALRNLVLFLSSTVLQLVSLLTGLGAVVLNGVVYYTVVKVSDNYASLTGINSAWSAIRDLANMGFIFILLYAAIQTILGIGSDTKKLIVNVIVVAILINFSLFFTKIVIDISNILALLFYDAIAPGALNATATLSLQQAGLSNAFMQHLSLQSIYQATSAENISFTSIITIGVMGSIMLLIAAFVFFAAAIIFIIRYVILILVLILSPIAFMAFVLPALKKHGDQWWDALSGQAFFAPIYFMLTWVALRVLGGVDGSGGITSAIRTTFGVDSTNAALSGLALTEKGVALSGGAFGMFINFIIVIVFLIASLIIAKEWANKAGGGVSGMTKWATGAAGGATLGLAARGGRNIIGSRAAAMAEDENLKERAAKGSRLARLQLATANKASTSSFDVRGTKLGGSLDAGKAQKGGFAQDQKDRAKAYEKYKPSSDTIAKAKTNETQARERLEEARGTAKTEADTAVTKSPELIEAEKQLKEAQDIAAQPSRLLGLSAEDVAAQKARNDAAVSKAQELVNTEMHKYEQAKSRFVETRTVAEKLIYNQASQRKVEIDTRMERMAQRIEKQRKIIRVPMPSGVFVSGKVKADAIRAAAKGKSRAERITELATEEAKEKEEKETPETSLPTPTPPAGGTPTT